MRPAIWIIGFGIFAQGTSELMVAGLVPNLAADLGVSIAQAGVLITAFALGMLVGAPLLGVITLRWPRRRALLAFVGVFVLSHVIGALSDHYWIVFATRLLAGFAYAGFWAVGASTAMTLAGPEQRGRAMSIVAGGLSLAMVVGLPAGTWVGQHLGWRGAFWAVAALAVVAAVAIRLGVPALRADASTRIREEFQGMRVPRLWLSYAMTTLAWTAQLGIFAYMAAMLVEATGLAATWVPVVLFGYGLGAFTGIVLGGKAADRYPRGVLGLGFLSLLITSVLLALSIEALMPTIAFVVALGLAGFSTNPALNARVVGIAPKAPTLAVAFNISAFNTGISLGPWIGGLVLSAGYGYAALAWTGAAFAALALLLWGADQVLQTRGLSASGGTLHRAT